MWYRTLQIYRLTQPIDTGPAFQSALGSDFARPCASMELATVGWTPPIRDGSDYAHTANGFVAICLQTEEKIVPSAGLKTAVDQKAADIQKAENRLVGRKERRQFLEELLMANLPHALSRITRTHAYIDPVDGLIIVDASAHSRAADVLSMLRSALFTLHVQPVMNSVSENAGQAMTNWLKNGPPERFVIGDRCELRDPGGEGGVVTCKRQALDSEEVAGHLAAGKVVSKLSVIWNDRLECVIDHELGIKQLKFLGVVQEQAAEIEANNEAERFDADFSIMGPELREFLRDLFTALGGVKEGAG